MKGRVFKRETVVKWQCSNCGHVHEGTEPPTLCPPVHRRKRTLSC